MNTLIPSEIIKVTLFTVMQAFFSMLVAVAAGVPSAFFIAKRKFFLRDFFISLSSVPLCVPSLIIALGYVSFFGMSGTLNRFFMYVSGAKNPPVTFLYSLAGIIIAQGFYNFPLVMSAVSDAWANLPKTESDAAKLLGAGNFRVFRTITFFQLLPPIISACILVFLYCFFSFMIVLLFGSVGVTTLEVEVYHLSRSSLDLRKALIMIVIETLTALLIVFFYCALEQKAQRIRGISFNPRQNERVSLRGKGETFCALAVFGVITIFFVAPLLSIVVKSVTKKSGAFCALSNFTFLLSRQTFHRALLWTMITALSTGTLSAAVAFLYSSFLRLRDPDANKIALRFVPMIPMAISSVAIGVIITMLVRKGNAAYLVAAQTFLTWPLAFRQIYPKLQKIPQSVIDSSRLLSGKTADTVLKIFLPVALTETLRGALFCFAVSAGDSTLPLVMAIPKFDTLALFTYRLAGAYKFNEACASGVILGAICVLSFALSRMKRSSNQTH